MAIILVPYHLDEHLPDLNVPLPPDRDTVAVTATLPEGDIWARLGELYGSVAGAVAEAAQTGDVAVVVSGDCTTSLGTMAGLRRAGVDAAVVWFDAHGDLQTLETTSSGYIGGMPLRILLGYRPELLSRRLGMDALAQERAVLVDARDLDPAEAEFLAAARVRRVAVEEVGADPLPAGPLLLHLDLDVIDAEEMTGLLYPVRGGPGVAAVLDAVRRVLDTGRVVAVDLACTWHPGHDDPTGVRARLVSDLITAAERAG